MRRTFVESFWSKVDKSGDCWVWTRAKNQAGYGVVRPPGGPLSLAHRESFKLSGRIIPEGAVLRHKCRNRSCVNPDHLETGSQRDNALDKIRDGTHGRGIQNSQAKLSERDVELIISLVAKTRVTYDELAAVFGVHRATIGLVAIRKNWGHL